MNEENRRTQRFRILKRLRNGSIRIKRNQGLVHFSDLSKLAPQYNARIFELREAGHNIVCFKTTVEGGKKLESFYRIYE